MAHGVRAEAAVLLDQPLGVIASNEFANSSVDLLDVLEDPAVNAQLLESLEEALDASAVSGWPTKA